MKTKLLLIFVFVLSITNCKNDTSKNETKTEEIVNEPSLLKLNNGEKWIANIETHDGVTQMNSIIKIFKSGTTKDYAVLGEALSEHTNMIIKKCSMKGEPHDQLHVVLVPMLDEISELKESKIEATSEKALQQLEALTVDYFKHFTT